MATARRSIRRMPKLRLGPVAIATGTVLALVPVVIYGAPEDGGEAVFVVLLFLLTVAPFVVFARLQRRWERTGAVVILGVLGAIEVFTIVSVARSEESTAGMEYVALPFVLMGALGLGAVAMRALGRHRAH